MEITVFVISPLPFIAGFSVESVVFNNYPLFQGSSKRYAIAVMLFFFNINK
ncbi:MAG: hypothetical protein NTY50_16710 [Methylobacter sp.]|nr:hypothetical protein [Methylobacter sp.]